MVNVGKYTIHGWYGFMGEHISMYFPTPKGPTPPELIGNCWGFGGEISNFMPARLVCVTYRIIYTKNQANLRSNKRSLGWVSVTIKLKRLKRSISLKNGLVSFCYEKNQNVCMKPKLSKCMKDQ